MNPPTRNRLTDSGVRPAIGETTGFTEYRASALLGYGVGTTMGRFSGFVSGSIGGGIIGQRTSAGRTVTTPTGLISPAADGEWWLSRRVGVSVEGELSVAIYKRDGQLVSSLWPALFGAVLFAL